MNGWLQVVNNLGRANVLGTLISIVTGAGRLNRSIILACALAKIELSAGTVP